MAYSADKPRLITYADLLHINTHMKLRRKLLNEIAEIDTFFSFEIEDSLVAAK